METFRRVMAIPTTYRGVLMRSKLESQVAAELDRLGIPWKYEPQIYWQHNVKGSGYLPDFRLWPDRRTDPWFLEIKPTGIYDERHTDATDLRNAIEKLLVIRHREPNATLVLWVADPRADDMGRLLVHVPRADGWVERPAIPTLRAAAAVYRRQAPRSWWRRLLRR
jgi:hypothetical protein